MYFVSQNIFTLSLAVLFLVTLLSMAFLRQKRNVPESSENHTRQIRIQRIRFISLAISAILLSTVLLGPAGLLKNTSDKIGIDQIWLLDVSASMDVVDMSEKWIPISRLRKAKGIIEEYMLEHPENRYGLVIFAGEWRLISPLTSEYTSLLTFLSGLDSKSISEWGTDFTDALSIALNRFGQDNTPHAIVLLSDGGDKDNGIDSGNIKNLFYNKKASLIALWIGQEKPSPIPSWRDMFGELTYKQFEGEIVLSWLNTESLKMLSNIGWGAFLSEESSLEKALSDIQRHSIAHSHGIDSTVSVLMLASFSFFLLFLLPSSFLKPWNAS